MDQVNAEQNIGDESADRKTEQGFTPGPWHQRDPDVPLGKDIVIDCGDPAQPHTLGAVATALNFANLMSFESGQRECDARMRANARLIAAAPALYERLKDLTERFTELDLQLCDDFEHADDCDCEGEKARAVLTLVDAPESLSMNNQVNDGQAS